MDFTLFSRAAKTTETYVRLATIGSAFSGHCGLTGPELSFMRTIRSSHCLWGDSHAVNDRDVNKPPVSNQSSPQPPIRDLADFHLRWRDFKPMAIGARDTPALSNEQRAVIDWLIRMADKIGPRDIG